MQKIKFVLNIFVLVFIAFFIVIGLLYMNFSDMLGKTACLTAMAVMPDGLFEKKSTFYSDITDNYENYENVVVNNQLNLNVPQHTSVSATVEETVIGHIVKKTLSPYNVNSSYGNVYLNNQSGLTVDIEKLLNSNNGLKFEKNGQPQVLIYHTHTTESYMESESQYYTDFDEPRTTDVNKNISAIGKRIADILEFNGYGVVHTTEIHDHPGFSGSYSRSAETVQKILEDYPSIKLVIDLHRDSIASGKEDKVAPVVTVDGREAAQIMLVMGSQSGSVTQYPNWQENLSVALKLQDIFEQKYPQFARSLLLRSAKYNQNLSSGAVLIEVGSDANTFEQAMYSGELIAYSLISYLDANN